MGFPGPGSAPTNLTGQIIGGELYLKAADVVTLLRDRSKECADAAAEQEAIAEQNHDSDAFMTAVAWRVAAEDYARRADWVDVAVMAALPATAEPGS